jgi:hypothetical protein
MNAYRTYIPASVTRTIQQQKTNWILPGESFLRALLRKAKI